MGLSGLEIYKKLPQTNCGECGVPTCLAFAMKLAAGQAELAKCPHVSEEAKAELAESSAPAIRGITIGNSDKSFKVGEETVLFRHEKRFENPTGLAVLISDDDSDFDAKLDRVLGISFDRIGLVLAADAIAVKGTDAAKFASAVEKVASKTDKGILLVSEDPAVIEAGIAKVADRKPLIASATSANWEKMAAIAKEKGASLVVKGQSLDEAAELSEKIANAGAQNLIIDSGSRDLGSVLADQTNIRRLALKKKFRPLGYPTVIMASEMADNSLAEATVASSFIAKYGGLVVLSDAQAETLYPLLVERMNIFTDPQRPMMVEEGVYEINDPGPDSPVLVTTNFSLTYFIVSSELESSRIGVHLAVHNSEGLSVLTAWAAGKFVSENIAPFLQKSGIFDKTSHKKLIIPGYVAQMSGELEAELPGIKVQVGPREAGDLPKFLKAWNPAKDSVTA